MLPNGNVLITESNNGRILEVTRDHKIVWECRNPSRLETDKRMVAVIFNAERYAIDSLPFVTPEALASAKAPAIAKSKPRSKPVRIASLHKEKPSVQ